MLEKKMSKKKSRIRQTKTEWQEVLEQYNNLRFQSWHFSLPELLHISIALDNNDYEKVKSDFIDFCDFVKKEMKTDKFYGNLSSAIEFIKKNQTKFELLKDNVFHHSITQILVFYKSIFQIEIEKSKYKSGSIINGFYSLLERDNDKTMICKFIFINQVYRNDTRPLKTIILTKEDVLESYNCSVINSAWLVITTSENIIDFSFANLIWHFNYINIPIKQSDDTENENNRYKKFNINELKEEFEDLTDRFRDIPIIALISRPIAEIIMGFINRSIYLTKEIIELVEVHKGEIAEAVLRMLYEFRLKFLWLLKKEEIELFQRFRGYSSGREKFFYEKMKLISNQENEHQSELLLDYQKELNSILKLEGLNEYEVAIERGDVFDIGVDKMADEIGNEEKLLYDFIYKRTSDIIHGNWRIIEKYHLIRSDNPMHDRLLYYNFNENKFAGLLPVFIALMLGSEVILKFLECFQFLFEDDISLLTDIKRYYEKIKRIFIEEYNPSIIER